MKESTIMIEHREDQASGLRRLFRRAPPHVAVLYATGRHRATSALQTAYNLAGGHGQVLLLDEAGKDHSLHHLIDHPAGADLLGVLGGNLRPRDLLQPIPGLLGRIGIEAAALALPLLDDDRRARLVAALRHLLRPATSVLIHSTLENATDPSPFVFAAPRHLIIAEASRSGATETFQLIDRLAQAGVSSLHIAVARAQDAREAQAFFTSLNQIVRGRIGVPLAWLGQMERDDLGAGLTHNAAAASQRGAEAAFLHRLEHMARTGALHLAPVRARHGIPS